MQDTMAEKALARQAPQMFEALTRLSSHKSFARLPSDLKTLIEEILANAPPADEAKPVDPTLSLL